MKKELTSIQIEEKLKEFCNKYKLVYGEFYIDKNVKWFVFSYGVKTKNKYKREETNYECYCMNLNNKNEFTSVKRGLTKQLLGYKIIDIENIPSK